MEKKEIPAERVEIGRKIRRVRKSLGDSQEAFAERFGKKQQSVPQWEAGLTMPDGETMLRIMELGKERFPMVPEYESESFKDGLGRDINVEDAVAMMTDIMTGPQIYKAALVSSVRALFKACKNEAEMEGMRGEMRGLGQKLDTLIAIVAGIQKGATNAAQG